MRPRISASFTASSPDNTGHDATPYFRELHGVFARQHITPSQRGDFPHAVPDPDPRLDAQSCESLRAGDRRSHDVGLCDAGIGRFALRRVLGCNDERGARSDASTKVSEVAIDGCPLPGEQEADAGRTRSSAEKETAPGSESRIAFFRLVQPLAQRCEPRLQLAGSRRHHRGSHLGLRLARYGRRKTRGKVRQFGSREPPGARSHGVDLLRQHALAHRTENEDLGVLGAVQQRAVSRRKRAAARRRLGVENDVGIDPAKSHRTHPCA